MRSINSRCDFGMTCSLGEYGGFDVSTGGQITGSGKTNYQFRVAAGSSAFSAISVTIPVGAVAMMDASETGERNFSITGQADFLENLATNS
jgi:hypothetical protein